MPIIVAAYRSSIKIEILVALQALKPCFTGWALQERIAVFTWFMYSMTIREVLEIIFDHFQDIKPVTKVFSMQSDRYLGKSIDTAEQAMSCTVYFLHRTIN